MCFTPPQYDLQVNSLPALKNGYLTFGCFNNLAKVNDEVLALWGEILAGLPNSRLLLRAKQLGDNTIRAELEARLSGLGLPLERVDLEGNLPTRQEGIAQYGRIDIALDTFPYTGATTTAESLWMGVPVLTRSGDSFISKVGRSINHSVGMADWVADTRDVYVRKAIAFGSDLVSLAGLRAGLRELWRHLSLIH
jgi:predicted O-linked N-acetylglucosamine transferase (SPINDLY family)